MYKFLVVISIKLSRNEEYDNIQKDIVSEKIFKIKVKVFDKICTLID